MEREYKARGGELCEFLVSMSVGDEVFIPERRHKVSTLRVICSLLKKDCGYVYSVTCKKIKRGARVTRLV